MLTSNRLPLLRRMRVKSVVTYDLKDIRKGSLLVLNLKDTTGIEAKLGPLNITQKNIFQQFYSDRKIRKQIGNKYINKVLINEREAYYKSINDQVPYLKGILEGRLGMGYNLVYDLSILNRIFDENTVMIAKNKKHKMYWDCISAHLDEVLPKVYKYKTMVINVEEYSQTIVQDIQSITDAFNPIAYLYRLMKFDVNEFYKLGDFDIILTNKTDSLRINPSQCRALGRTSGDNKIYSTFRTELFKLLNKADPGDSNVSDAERILAQNKMVNDVVSRYMNGLTGEVPEEVKEKITKAVEKAVDNNSESSDMSESKIEDVVNNDVDLIKSLVIDTTNKSMKQTASTKRDELLREKQFELKLKDKTVKEILELESANIPIEVNDISAKVDTINKNLTDVRFPNINKTYVDKLMPKDITDILIGLNNKSLPVYVRSINVEDTSDISNYKETYTVELEDSLRVRHRLVFDLPKVIDGRFLYLGGNRKYINNQQMLLPIVKTAPDTVQLVSNYNKIFIKRYGDKVGNINEKLKKALNTNVQGIRVIPGKYDTENKRFVTTIIYDDLSKNFKEITIGKHKFYFNQSDIRDQVLSRNIKGLKEKLDVEVLPLGHTQDRFMFINLKTNEVVFIDDKGKEESTKMELVDYMMSLSPKLASSVSEQQVGRKYMYTRATIMTKKVPIILLLAYFEGIDGILKKANIKHYFSDTRPRIDSDETIIQFKDGYLVYSQKPYENALLMNGLLDVPTKNYNYSDFNDKFMYQSVFETMFGRRNIANAFDNFLDNFLEPMTIDALNRLSLPTDLTGMMIYANSLLTDNQFTHETDMKLYKIRNAEVITSIMYKHISKAYEKYKATAQFSNPHKISIKKDAILKDVLSQQIVEDYSELNPISEVQKLRGCTKKGPSGCNLAQAYTEEQRSFNHSMTGVFTISSSPDGNVGKYVLPLIEAIL